LNKHAPSSATEVKLDVFNRKILAIVHKQANISNAELASRIGLSPSACSQRTNALRKAGYFKTFTAELDLDRICQNVCAIVEFALERNDVATRRKFVDVVLKIPEFADCIRFAGGEMEFASFVCCSNIAELDRLCDELSGNTALGIKRVLCRVVVERPKWFQGYAIAKLKWFDE
jgi:Lrp/AsnC family transcriptional regulator, leucine-responsive regulatory protein